MSSNLICGALNPISTDAILHANRMYDIIRKRSTDILNISRNTNFTFEQVSLIKNYIFFGIHVLIKW